VKDFTDMSVPAPERTEADPLVTKANSSKRSVGNTFSKLHQKLFVAAPPCDPRGPRKGSSSGLDDALLAGARATADATVSLMSAPMGAVGSALDTLDKDLDNELQDGIRVFERTKSGRHVKELWPCCSQWAADTTARVLHEDMSSTNRFKNYVRMANAKGAAKWQRTIAGISLLFFVMPACLVAGAFSVPTDQPYASCAANWTFYCIVDVVCVGMASTLVAAWLGTLCECAQIPWLESCGFSLAAYGAIAVYLCRSADVASGPGFPAPSALSTLPIPGFYVKAVGGGVAVGFVLTCVLLRARLDSSNDRAAREAARDFLRLEVANVFLSRKEHRKRAMQNAPAVATLVTNPENRRVTAAQKIQSVYLEYACRQALRRVHRHHWRSLLRVALAIMTGPIAHCSVLFLVIIFFNAVPAFWQGPFAVTIPVTNAIFIQITRRSLVRVNAQWARPCSQFHSCIGSVLRMMVFGAAKNIGAFLCMVTMDVIIMMWQSWIASSRVSHRMHPSSVLRCLSHEYDMCLVIAIDYLNQTVGIVSWIIVYFAVRAGPNADGGFIDMRMNYAQACIWSSLAFVVTTMVFHWSRHMKIRESMTLKEKAYTSVDSIDLYRFLVYMFEDPNVRRITLANIMTSVSFSFFWLVQHNGMESWMVEIDREISQLSFFEEEQLGTIG
jgi:uncharacterized membrane protein